MKYHNKKHNGFDSLKEERRYRELLLEARVGRITELRRQPKFELIPHQTDDRGRVIERAVEYIADFSYYRGGVFVVEDVKSDITRKLPEYIIKRKLMLYLKHIKVVEII